MPTALISTMGTSLLTNGADTETRALLSHTANTAQADLTDAQKAAIQNRTARVREALQQASPQAVAALSAELNGVIKITESETVAQHYLLHTDTFQGRITAELVADWLRANGSAPVTVCCLEHLTTANQDAFQQGMDSLLQWCDTTIPALREQRYRIVFNLVGGFKSMQAYMQTLGMLFADETTYIFEAPGSALLRIPRLPLQWTPLSDTQAALLARLVSADTFVPRSEIGDLPDAYLTPFESGSYCVSYWGKAVWLSKRRDIFADRLLPQPGLEYAPSFMDDFRKTTDPRLRCDLQEALAKASVLWREGGLTALRKDGGLLYETYRNSNGIGHFRLNDGERVSNTVKADRLILRHFGTHDHVEKNP